MTTSDISVYLCKMPPDRDNPFENRQILRGTPEQRQRLGRRIAEARTAMGWDQAEFGGQLGRTQPWVSRVERGVLTPSLYEYARIADMLHIGDDVLRELAWLGIDRD